MAMVITIVLGHPIQHGEAVVADQPLQGKLADQQQFSF